MSKPGKSLKTLCKKLGVRLTVKRGKKRVYKSVKVLKSQCERKRKVVKRKRRRRKFGTGTPEQGRPDSVETPRTVRGNPNAITPGYWNSPPGWLRNSPGDFPSPGMSPIMLPPSVRSRLGPRRLFVSDSDSDSDSDEEVRRQLFRFAKKKKVKRKRRRRKFGKKSKKKSVDIVSFAKKNKIPLGIAATILSSVGIGYYIKNRKSSTEQLAKKFYSIPDSTNKMEFLESLSSDKKNDVEMLLGYHALVATESSRIFINELHMLNKSDSDKLKKFEKGLQLCTDIHDKQLLLYNNYPSLLKIVKKYNKNFPDYEEFKKIIFKNKSQ